MNSVDKASAGRWTGLFSVLILVLILGALTLLLPDRLQQSTPDSVQLTPPACDLNQGPCRLKQGDIELEFSLGPLPLRSMTALNAQLGVKGIEPERVRLSLEGREMYMGLNQAELTPTGSAGNWRGSTELAACTTGRMVWRARLTLHTNERQYETWFDFEAR